MLVSLERSSARTPTVGGCSADRGGFTALDEWGGSGS